MILLCTFLRPPFSELVKRLEAARAAEGDGLTPPVQVNEALKWVVQSLGAQDLMAKTIVGSLHPYDDNQEALMSYEEGKNAQAATAGGTLMMMSGLVLTSLGDSLTD